VDDLLDRRMRIGLVPADRERAIGAAEQALDLGRRAGLRGR
jgi:glycerol-3-phosphate dehydrogenase